MSTYITEVISTFSAVLFPDACPSVINLNNVNSVHNSKPQLTHEAGCPQRREQAGHSSAWAPTVWTGLSPPVGRAWRKAERQKGLAFHAAVVPTWCQYSQLDSKILPYVTWSSGATCHKNITKTDKTVESRNNDYQRLSAVVENWGTIGIASGWMSPILMHWAGPLIIDLWPSEEAHK